MSSDDISLPDHAGRFYQECLRALHAGLRPRAYLEIGSLHGDTLALAQCASIAVDPQFQITKSIMGNKPSLFLFQMTSDEFFVRHSPFALLGRPIDLAFLDGLHLFECLLRDFTQTERNCQPESVIVLHDCIPLDLHMAVRDVGDTFERSRSRYPLWWTGDVWKLVPVLWRYRPDLVVRAFNAPPTGLVLVSNLDPGSDILRDRYAEIVSSLADPPDPAGLFRDYLARLDIIDTEKLDDAIAVRSDRGSSVASMPAETIVTQRLRGMLANGSTSPEVRAAGIGEVRLIASEGSYTRAPPVFVDAGRATPESRQQFEVYMRALQQAHEALYCLSLRDATVLGQGSVVTRNGILLWESAAEFLAQGLSPDGLRYLGDDKWRRTIELVRTVHGPSLLLKRPWFRNFGHWLIDSATLLALLNEDVSHFGWTIVVGSDGDPAMDRIVNETLNLLAPGIPVLRQPDHEAWQFADLRYAMPVHVPPLFKLPAAIRRLRSLLLEAPDLGNETVPAQPRRLYLSRADAGTRRVVNESSIVPLLSGMGFETIYLRGLTLQEQARLFNGAEAVVGAKGAALANIMFCQPSCSVMVLSPEDFPDPFFWDIAGQLGLRYAELFGTATTSLPAGLNDFVVDPAAVARMLAAVLQPKDG